MLCQEEHNHHAIKLRTLSTLHVHDVLLASLDPETRHPNWQQTVHTAGPHHTGHCQKAKGSNIKPYIAIHTINRTVWSVLVHTGVLAVARN